MGAAISASFEARGLLAAAAACAAVNSSASFLKADIGLSGVKAFSSLYASTVASVSFFSGTGLNALGAAAGVNGDALSSCFAVFIGLNALEANGDAGAAEEANGDAGAAETADEAKGDDGAAAEDANGDVAAGVSSSAFAAGSGLAAGLAEPADDGLEAAAGLVKRVSVLAVPIGLNGLATSGVVFLGAGASFAFFSEAGLNALGVPAGL